MGILSQIKAACDRNIGSPDRLRGTQELKKRVAEWWKYDDPKRIIRRASRLGLTEMAQIVAHTMQSVASNEQEQELEHVNPLERILGRNDLMSSLFLPLGWTRARAVGRILTATGFGFGTGFLISSRLMMTNRHVLETAEFARRCKVQFDYAVSFDGEALAPTVFRLQPDVFFLAPEPDAEGDDDLDYAIVAVEQQNEEGAKLASRGRIPIIAQTGKASLNEQIHIIQHPGGEPQQIAIRNNLIVELLPGYLRYETDTQPGSSGSPCFNSQWEIAALHHSGVPEEVAEGVYRLIDGTTWDTSVPLSRPEQVAKSAKIVWKSNEGVRISRIVADARNRLANTPAELAMLEEAIQEDAETMELPVDGLAVEQQNQLGKSAIALSGIDGRTNVSPDGRLTLTVPLQVSVQLGNIGDVGVGQPAEPGSDAVRNAVPISTPFGKTRPGSLSLPQAVNKVREALKGEASVVDVRAGYVFENDWITDTRAVVVAVRSGTDALEAVSRRKNRVEQEVGFPLEITPASLEDLLEADGSLLPAEMRESIDLRRLVGEAAGVIGYRPPEGLSLDEVEAPMEVICHVSPDQGWPILERFLRGTRNRLTVGIYDFTAPHIFDKVFEEVEPPPRKFTLVIQEKASGVGTGTKSNDIPEQELVAEFRAALGDRFQQDYAIVTGARQIFDTSYHIKVAVRNGTQFWLSSGNWQSSNQPDIDPAKDNETTFGPLRTFNRDWHVWVKHRGLADTFEKFLLHDLEQIRETQAEVATERLPDLIIPEALAPSLDELLVEEAAAQYFPSRKFPRDPNKPVKVKPLLTPDNFQESVIELIDSAKEKLYFQNQTLGPAKNNDPRYVELIDALRRKQEEGLDVRIVIRVFFFSATRVALERLKELGLDTNGIRLQKNCHTKGIMVDSKKVLIGSHNWSNSGTLRNRDASLIFDHEGITKYYEEIFLFDWDNLAKQQTPPPEMSPEIAMPERALSAESVAVPWRHVFED